MGVISIGASYKRLAMAQCKKMQMSGLVLCERLGWLATGDNTASSFLSLD